ncbi:hypothetical protein V1264_011109 [Littorina saxatilis]|uniref:RNA-directed DNA polymerase n=1 Tax=Littorina saxatilis TaxID=31220 RepID=A0AAN9BTG4_9CAEN
MAEQLSALPTYPSFDCSSDGVSIRWSKWIVRLENLFVAFNIANDQRKKALLLTYAGNDLNDIVDSFPAADLTPRDGETHFQKLVDRINEHFNPQINREYQVFTFRQLTQTSDSVDIFYQQLKRHASLCNFANIESEIKSQLITGCKVNKVREKGLSNPGITLSDLLQYARTLELTASYSRKMHEDGAVNRLHRSATSSQHQPDRRHHQPRRSQASHRHNQPTEQCKNCGGTWPHEKGQHSCPAFNKQCRSCGKFNHFSSVCRSSPRNTARSGTGGRGSASSSSSSQQPRSIKHKPKPVHHVEQHGECDNNDASFIDDGNDADTEYVFTANGNSNQLPRFKVYLNGQQTTFLADSGATVNLLSRTDYESLTPKPPLSPSNVRISAYGNQHSIRAFGQFCAELHTDTASCSATICVVPGNEKPILSWTTSQTLKLLTTVHCIEHKTQQENQLGKLNDRQIKLHIDETVQPVAQHYRRVPFHVRKHVEEQIRKDEELGVIEKATGPTPWVSPIVVVPKPKSPGKVRVCVDMRSANKAIRRERHATPTLDELKTMLAGAKVFSKLDLNQGYNQLELAEESRYITTFSTHLGLYRYRRLFFGVNSASEIFQETIRQVLSGLKGVVNISDDILCYGTSQQDHDNNLRALMQRLREKDLTLNTDKCEYNKKSLEFLGHIFGEDGITPSQDKLKTILELPTPTNASEVRSLLGMMNFCGAHFIPNYATLTHELRLLTKKTTPWSWNEKHDAALRTLKAELSKATTLAYFNPGKPTEIYTDGSPVGISAVLTQDKRIIQFASRALTPTEQRYSQTEREALAITWACEYFHIYLFGATFTVYTDHKPLVSMFNNPRAQLSARVERWVLRTQPYEMTVQYRPGFDNPADYLSRHPVQQHPSSREEKIAEEYLHYVVDTSTPKAMTLDTVISETAKDVTLTAVINAILTSDWEAKDDVDTKTFRTLYLCRSELSLSHNASVLLKGTRIVLPESLHLQAVKVAHTGHQGIVKTVALLREKVWFRGMQETVEKAVKNCLTCQISTPTPAREPLKMSPLPTAPWSELSADFADAPNGNILLVITDEYSRFTVVDILQSTSSRSVIPRLDKIFAEYGIPDVLKTDNGPPFNSHEFATYATHTGFKHRKITPLWPRANGETERFMRTIKKTVKAAHAQQLNWKQEMYKFLLDYRTTPHCTTGVAPATALFGRNIKNRLPQLPPQQPADAKMRQQDAHAKAKMKLYADNKNYVKPSNLQIGDSVLIRDTSIKKSTPPFNPTPLTVVSKNGSMISACRGNKIITRNSSFFKRSPRHPTPSETNDAEADAEAETEAVTLPHTDEPNSQHAHNKQNQNAQNTHTNVAPTPRRSHREKHLPTKLQDFVLT